MSKSSHFRQPAVGKVWLEGARGEGAILSNASDYRDMWQAALTEKGEIDTARDVDYRMVNTNEAMLDRRDTYFRNFGNVPAVSASYRFGTNVVIHLLTRWEDRVNSRAKDL